MHTHMHMYVHGTQQRWIGRRRMGREAHGFARGGDVAHGTGAGVGLAAAPCSNRPSTLPPPSPQPGVHARAPPPPACGALRPGHACTSHTASNRSAARE